LLLEKGAVINTMNREGLTPMDIAKKSGYQEIAKLLDKNTSK
jgi:ankyrin repeat protein